MLFWIIVIIFVVYYVSKKKQAAEGMQNRRGDLYGDYGQGAYGANTAPRRRFPAGITADRMNKGAP